MKKTLVVLAMLALLAASLAPVALADDPVTVTYWHIFPQGDVFYEIHNQMIQDYNASQTSVKVVDVGLGFFDFLDKINVAVASGEGPDVSFSGDVQTHASKQALVELTPYIERSGFPVNDVYEAAFDGVSYEGGIYGMPMTWSCKMLVYNKDMLAAAGYTQPPKTWAELEEMNEKLTVLSPDGGIEVLGFHPALGNSYYRDYLITNGSSQYDEEGNPAFNTQRNVEAIQWYVDMYNRFGVDAAAAFTSTAQTTADPLLSGMVAMEVEVQDFLKNLKDAKADGSLTFEYGIAPVPYNDRSGVADSATLGGGFSLEIYDHRKQDQIDASWDFITWMVNEENQTRWAWENSWAVPNRKVMAADQFANDPDWGVISAEMEKTVLWPWREDLTKAGDVFQSAVDESRLGMKSVQQALDDAQAMIIIESENYWLLK